MGKGNAKQRRGMNYCVVCQILIRRMSIEKDGCFITATIQILTQLCGLQQSS